MVRFTHPEMFYLFIPFGLMLIWYAFKGYKIRKKLESLGSFPIKKLLLNRLKFSRIRFRSRLIVLGIIFILIASVGPQIGIKLTELKREGIIFNSYNGSIRMVTHYGIASKDIDKVIEIIIKVVKNLS